MTENAAASSTEDASTLYTAYEIDFMLSLRDTEAARTTREQIGIHSAPEEAAAFVATAVTAGLRARGKVELSDDGQWLLGHEGRIIAATLTGADRWLGMALTEAGAMRMTFFVAAGDSVLMLTQDDLDTFQISALGSPAQVPVAVTDIARAFLGQSAGTTVSLRRCDGSAPAVVSSLMLRQDQGGGLQLGHEPLDADGQLTISAIEDSAMSDVIARLWESGASSPA